jgi:hypothetical protein
MYNQKRNPSENKKENRQFYLLTSTIEQWLPSVAARLFYRSLSTGIRAALSFIPFPFPLRLKDEKAFVDVSLPT